MDVAGDIDCMQLELRRVRTLYMADPPSTTLDKHQ